VEERAAQRQAEEGAIRARMAELHQELDVLQARLQALGRTEGQPPPRPVHLAFRLGASPPGEPPVAAPAPPPERAAQAAGAPGAAGAGGSGYVLLCAHA